uniref:BAHD acyltransferase At5g47980-like n=1 Tax=Fragaria vesca subsp. vesca TaxID=101020 RepID=UPI0005CAC09D|nr:PREDICTED: BAHD acyltransferase At5g47980-like [Fragaria vesca subsp. vesca]
MFNSTEELVVLKKVGVQCRPRRAPRVIEVNWHSPPYGCIKLNTDGAWKSSSNKAGYGGVFRDYNAKVMGAFCSNLNIPSSVAVEVMAVIKAIELAWVQEWKQSKKVYVLGVLITNIGYESGSKANASSLGTTRPALLIPNVNLRSRMVPPLPENYVGNLSWVFLVLKREDSLHSLVGQMKEALSEFCNTYVKNVSRGTELVLSIRKQTEKVKEMYKSSEQVVQYNCSSWCRFPIYEADFGWGKPVWVSIGACLDKNVILLDSKSGDGIEAIATLEEQDMAAFECDQELLAFAAQNSNPLRSQV